MGEVFRAFEFKVLELDPAVIITKFFVHLTTIDTMPVRHLYLSRSSIIFPVSNSISNHETF